MAEITIEERFFRHFDIDKKRVAWNVYFNNEEGEYSTQCEYKNSETQRDAIERIEKQLNEENRYGKVRVSALYPVEQYPKVDNEKLLLLLLVLSKYCDGFTVHSTNIKALEEELFEYCLQSSKSNLQIRISQIFTHKS